MSAAKKEQYYRVDITRYPALSIEAELEMFADYGKRRTAVKREKIVRQYLYWATELACRYCGPRMSKPEAISAANYGLMRAIEKFDPALGRRFVTYSYFIIRQEVLCALRDSYVVNPDPGLWAARTRFRATSGTPEDLKALRLARAKVFGDTSVPVPVGPQAESGPEDSFVEEDGRNRLEQASLLEALKEALPSLSPELRKVVELRYLNAGGSLTFVQIGARVGCTPNRAQFLHARAIKSLQRFLRPLNKEL